MDCDPKREKAGEEMGDDDDVVLGGRAGQVGGRGQGGGCPVVVLYVGHARPTHGTSASVQLVVVLSVGHDACQYTE